MRTLIIAPHIDDESISCGGLIVRRVSEAGKVWVLVVHGRHYGNLDPNAQDASDGRELEDFRAAADQLGVDGRPVLLLEEGEPQHHGFYRLLSHVEHFLKTFQPNEVVIPSADDLNQDHRHLNHVAKIAMRPIALGDVKRVLEFVALDGTARRPNYFVALTRSELNLKLSAINCYRRERRGLPSPRAPENVEAQARVWGAACGAEFAEAYVQTLGIE